MISITASRFAAGGIFTLSFLALPGVKITAGTSNYPSRSALNQKSWLFLNGLELDFVAPLQVFAGQDVFDVFGE
jgi:hypothetical protein